MWKKVIKLVNDEKPPLAKCSKCYGQSLINLDHFKKDCSNIQVFKCTKCGSEMYIGLLIVNHHKLNVLLDTIKRIIQSATITM